MTQVSILGALIPGIVLFLSPFVLPLAATQATLYQGKGLLLMYSLGLGLPLFLAANSVNGLLAFAARFKRFLRQCRTGR
jgi:cytochrome c biogenesis protein CcdA